MLDELTNMLMVIPNDFLVAFAMSKLLDMRHPWRFVAIYLLFLVPFAFFRGYFDATGRIVIGGVVLILFQIIIPMLMSQGKRVRRVTILVLVYIIVIIGELSAGGVWYLLTGTSLADTSVVRDDPALFLFTYAINLLFLIVLYALLYSITHRSDSPTDSYGLQLFVWFPTTQLALMFMLVILLFFGTTPSPLLGWSPLLALFCIATDVILFVAMNRYALRTREEQRAAALGEQLDWRMRQYEKQTQDIEKTAHMRHDLRNQLQTIAILKSRGETESAHAHLQSLICSFETAAADEMPARLKQE